MPQGPRVKRHLIQQVIEGLQGMSQESVKRSASVKVTAFRTIPPTSIGMHYYCALTCNTVYAQLLQSSNNLYTNWLVAYHSHRSKTNRTTLRMDANCGQITVADTVKVYVGETSCVSNRQRGTKTGPDNKEPFSGP